MRAIPKGPGYAWRLFLPGALVVTFLLMPVIFTACGSNQPPTTNTSTSAPSPTTKTSTVKVKVKGVPNGKYELSGSGSVSWTLVPHVPGCTGSMPHALPLTVPPTEIDTSQHAITVTLEGMNFGTVSMVCGGHPVGGSASNGGPLQMTLVTGPPATFTESNPTPLLQGVFGFMAPAGFVPQVQAGCKSKTTTNSEGTTSTSDSCKSHKGPVYTATATLTSYPCLAESNITCTGSGTIQLTMIKG